MTEIVAVLTGIVSLISGVVVALVSSYQQIKSLRKQVRLIAIIDGTEKPTSLRHIPCFTSYRKAVSHGGTVLWRTYNLRSALKRADYVCYDETLDPKVHRPEWEYWDDVANSE